MECFWKWGCICLDIKTRARVTFSIIWYLVSAAWNVQLTIDRSSFSTSWTSVVLTASLKTAKYTTIGWSGLDFCIITDDDRKFFSCWRISSHISSQLNFTALWNSYTIDLVFLTSRGKNLKSALTADLLYFYYSLYNLIQIPHNLSSHHKLH